MVPPLLKSESESERVRQLVEALEPFAWVQVTPTVSVYADRFVLDLVCLVRPTEDALSPRWTGNPEQPNVDALVRRALYRRAEGLLDEVKRSGWKHIRAPRIEFDGDMVRDAPGPVRILHRCEVRLELTYST